MVKCTTLTLQPLTTIKLNYSKSGNEYQHLQILSLLLREEEVCKTVNQTVTLPVGLLQRHHAHAPQTTEDREQVNLGKRKHW